MPPKIRKITSSLQLQMSSAVKDTPSDINWNLCALCQTYRKGEETNKGNKLVFPCRKNGSGYDYVGTNLQKFQEQGVCPIPVELKRLDQGCGFAETFRLNSAGWHKNCRQKVSTEHLQTVTKQSKKRALECDEATDEGSPRKTRRTTGVADHDPVSCFFCGEDHSDLHNASTMELDQKVRQYATVLRDGNLLAKLAAGDMVAIEAKYHLDCLSSFYRRAEKLMKIFSTGNGDNSLAKYHAVAFAELVSYIESFRDEPDVPVFTMPDLCKLYKKRLTEFGVKDPDDPKEPDVHSTRLREKLEIAIPDLRSAVQGRQVVLMFNSDLGHVIKKACTQDSDMLHFVKAAQLVRKELGDAKTTFSGKFEKGCQSSSVPFLLKALVSMIINGPQAIENDDEKLLETQTVLSISQMISFNMKKKAPVSAKQRHNVNREPPLPVYLGLKIHSLTRKKELVDIMHNFGMAVSYNRVLTISTDIANSVCKHYEANGVVVPPRMVPGAFTVGVVDNIDINPSSTTASDSFHGTSLSLIQHGVDATTRQSISVFDSSVKGRTHVAELPLYYTDVPPVFFSSKEMFAPQCRVELEVTVQEETEKQAVQQSWLDHCQETLPLPELENDSVIPAVSWPAFHATHQRNKDRKLSQSVLLPLLPDPAHSLATIKHAMGLVSSAVKHLNPQQKPVIAMDQPLYALAKEIQWKCHESETLGEKDYIVVMGGLHIEKAALQMLGDWLQGSGWVNVLSASGVTTSGRADSFLKASHITRTRHAHQITAAAVFILMQKAYRRYKASCDSPLKFEEWCSKVSKEQPQFAYWLLTLRLELMVLELIHSFRDADFTKYLECLCALVPWMFALDHTHYARWLSVHIRDMKLLEETHSDVFQRFCDGAFVVQKTMRKFSAMALDQEHEQNNGLVKGVGGPVGLTSSLNALRRWMTAGPEITTLLRHFEGLLPGSSSPQLDHHAQTRSAQKAFSKEVTALVAAFEELGNPFLEDSGYLIALDTQNVMPPAVVETIYRIADLGKQQFHEFVQQRLQTPVHLDKPAMAVDATLKRNSLPCFANPGVKTTGIAKSAMAALKNDCALFSKLYIACQTRNGDMSNFFCYENQPWPPSLFKVGEFRTGNKADLVGCLVKAATDVQELTDGLPTDPLLEEVPNDVLDFALALPDDELEEMALALPEDLWEEAFSENDISMDPEPTKSHGMPAVDAIILDGAAVVQMLPPKLTKTFQEYTDCVFIPYVLHQLENASRVDIVFDVYLSESLKSAAREKRGRGLRRKVSPSAPIPGNWRGFLRIDKNKEELFGLLATAAANVTVEGKVIVVTYLDSVMSSPPLDNVDPLQPCSHEEADTRVLLHAKHCSSSGHKRVLLRTTDSDVVVLAVAFVHRLELSELWIAFGTGKHFQCIAAHVTASKLGRDRAEALPVFHAFTGCDTVSFFSGRGKVTAWDTWGAYPEATKAFLDLARGPDIVPDSCLKTLECFVVLLYDKTSDFTTVNKVRMHLFTKKGRSVENIPPTQAALHQHIMRSAFQGGHIWGQCLEKNPHYPTPSQWGWKPVENTAEKTSAWVPIWTTLAEAAQSSRILIRCSCKVSCTGRCSCAQEPLSCTPLCDCVCGL